MGTLVFGNVGKVAPPATLVFGNLEKWATRRAYAPAADARSPNCFAGASTIMARPMAISIAAAGHSSRDRASRNTMTVITAARANLDHAAHAISPRSAHGPPT